MCRLLKNKPTDLVILAAMLAVLVYITSISAVESRVSVDGVRVLDSYENLEKQLGSPTFMDYIPGGGSSYENCDLFCEYENKKWRRVAFGKGTVVLEVSGQSLEIDGRSVIKVGDRVSEELLSKLPLEGENWIIQFQFDRNHCIKKIEQVYRDKG